MVCALCCSNVDFTLPIDHQRSCVQQLQCRRWTYHLSAASIVTAIVKVRHFHARSPDYANTDATRTGGRFHVSLLLIMAGDVELNPGPQPSARKRAALQRYQIVDRSVSSPSSQYQTLDPPVQERMPPKNFASKSQQWNRQMKSTKKIHQPCG